MSNRDDNQGAQTEVQTQLFDAVRPAVVPLLARQNGEIRHGGTGTLLRVGSSILLIGASHVMVAEVHGIELMIPLPNDQQISPGGPLIYGKDLAAHDVAIVRLSDTAVSELLGAGRRALDLLSPDDLVGAPPAGNYGIVGYAEALTRKQGEHHVVEAAFYQATRYDDDDSWLPLSEFDHELHFLLRYDTAGRQPSPKGLSGGAVWAVSGPSDRADEWKFHHARWLGVQCGFYSDRNAIKVVRWKVVEGMIAQQWSDLAPLVRLRGPGRIAT